MAIRAAILKEWWYTPRSERKEDKPARFLVAVLSRRDKALIQDGLGEIVTLDDGRQAFRSNTGTKRLRMLKRGLRGWENVMADSGKPAAFAAPDVDGGCADSNLDAIPDEIADELADVIERGGELSDDDAKN